MMYFGIFYDFLFVCMTQKLNHMVMYQWCRPGMEMPQHTAVGRMMRYDITYSC